MEKEVNKAEAQSLRKAKVIARKWSSGAIKTATLAAMGHPYAQRHPRPLQDAAIINAQTGAFKAAWTTVSFNWAMGTQSITGMLVNPISYAGYMWGTRIMIPRGIIYKVKREIEPIRIANIERAIERAMR